MAHLVKYLPAMWETWVRSLGWEVPLEKGVPTHSSILAWRIPWTDVIQSPFVFFLGTVPTTKGRIPRGAETTSK